METLFVVLCFLMTAYMIPTSKCTSVVGPFVDGRYELAKGPDPEHFKGFVDALGVKEPYTTIMRKMKNVDIVDLKNNSLKISVSILNFTKVIQFENGKEFDDLFIDGRPYKALFTVSGNQMTNLWTFPNGPVAKGSFTFSHEGFDQTCEAKGNAVKRVFKRIPRS